MKRKPGLFSELLPSVQAALREALEELGASAGPRRKTQSKSKHANSDLCPMCLSASQSLRYCKAPMCPKCLSTDKARAFAPFAFSSPWPGERAPRVAVFRSDEEPWVRRVVAVAERAALAVTPPLPTHDGNPANL